MIAGHYAAALVPYELTKNTSPAPFWLLLFAAQFLDFLMLLFVSVGVEKLEPTNFLDLAFASTHSELFVSHDMVPVFGWAVVFGACVWGLTKNRTVAIWCIGLVLIHEIFDFVVGFEHFVLGSESMALGFNLYNNAPIVGLIIEAALCAAIVFWFCRRRAQRNEPASPTLKWGLYGLLVGADELYVPLTWKSDDGLDVTKTFIFHRGRYDIEVRHDLTNRASGNWTGNRYDQLQRTRPDESSKRSFTNPGRYSYVGDNSSSWPRRARRWQTLSWSQT